VREAEERRALLVQLEAEVLVEIETQRRAAEESRRVAQELQARRRHVAQQRRQQRAGGHAAAAGDRLPDEGFVGRLHAALGEGFAAFQQSFRLAAADCSGQVGKEAVARALQRVPKTPQVCRVALRDSCCLLCGVGFRVQGIGNGV